MEKNVEFKGRKFTAALTLFKEVDVRSIAPYQLRVVAYDDEPMHRHTETFAEADQVKDMNILKIRYTSSGQPEEIQYTLSIEPVK